MNFLKENWIWILAPIVLFALAVAIVIMTNDGGALGQHEYSVR